MIEAGVTWTGLTGPIRAAEGKARGVGANTAGLTAEPSLGDDGPGVARGSRPLDPEDTALGAGFADCVGLAGEGLAGEGLAGPVPGAALGAPDGLGGND